MIDAGTMLAGRYRVVRHLGTGGMASVYLAEDTVLGREVAVKRVHAEPDSENGRRIVREAKIGATLRHPSLVTVFDIASEADALLLVMEYVPGETLGERLRRGPLAPEQALAVLRPLAEALDYAHSEGIVHRDVKPANVLLRSDGAVKLADLGVATSEEMTQITRTGGLLGTVAYMAPEQVEPGPVTPAADVYALASVAFEVLAGRRPHQAQSPLELMGQIREAPRPDLSDARADTPAAVAEALQRGMAREPADRPSSAGELVTELEAAFGLGSASRADPNNDSATMTMPALAARSEPVPDREPEPEDAPTTIGSTPSPAAVHAPAPRREGRKRGIAAAVLGLLLLAVIATVALSGGDDPERNDTAKTKTGTTSEQQGTQETQAAAKPPRADATPVSAVRAFYTRAAEGDFDGAWNLAGPRFRQAFGSRAGLEDTLGSLRSIEFVKLEETGRSGTTATLQVQTVAEHSTRTDRCSGTLQAVRKGDGWRVEPAGLSCKTDP